MESCFKIPDKNKNLVFSICKQGCQQFINRKIDRNVNKHQI